MTPTTPTQILWNPPRFREMQKERDQMVKTQMSGFFRDEVKDQRVLDAMRHVPRHLFTPRKLINNAYEDNPLPIGYGQTISQPYIVAYMTEILDLKPTDKILEIGTGSGYQAAVLSELTPHVYTIEIIEPLAEQAIERFRSLGYKTIQSKRDDGYYGWKEFAPFDAIIVTAAAGHIPQPLIEQLSPGGRMIIPVGGPYEVQNLVVVTKSGDGSLKTRTLIPVRFVPLTGKIQKE
ncbi:protein-L-isoaspartate(D-aspartate) O-methyltransferase [Candidatus Sumerlaeota bacterium]|nr:protein-L-isoaspartate(D-aspartate) O-methyltransferase [Candidatus Sumerlaeota bacterium]